MAKFFDDLNSIDGFFIDEKNRAAGISIRCSFTGIEIISFRYERYNGTKTEYQKIKEAINDGAIYPHLGLVLIAKNNKLMKIITYSVKQLMEASIKLKENVEQYTYCVSEGDGKYNKFLNFPLSFLIENQIKFKITTIQS